jgi:hypothetical protein
MHEQTPAVDQADEEVAFWRSFIEWWAREEKGPLPPRAWEALDYAERKRRDLEAAESARHEIPN